MESSSREQAFDQYSSYLAYPEVTDSPWVPTSQDVNNMISEYLITEYFKTISTTCSAICFCPEAESAVCKPQPKFGWWG